MGWATGVSETHTAFVKCTYMERVIMGSNQACEEGEESKVLETLRTDCGLGNRY
jgi:hypothetical protein